MRWLGIEKVLELLNSLVTYVLIILKSCQNKIFLKEKNRVGSTDRYQRISK